MMRTTALVAVLLGLSLRVARAEAPPPPSPQDPPPPASAAPDAAPPADAAPPPDAAAPKCSGTVVGAVHDATSRAPVQDLVVTAYSSALSGERTVVTNASGEYRIPDLPPGDYTLRFEKEGYKPYARGRFTVVVEKTIRINIAVTRESVRPQEIVVVGRGLSARERSMDSMLLPASSLELGGELTFIVSDSSPKAGEGLSFTDVGLMTLNSRYSFGPVELVAAADLLIKEPSYLDEPIPQSGSLSVLVALGERQALGLSGAIGPLLLDQGRWESATLALYAKRSAHETLLFKGSLGGNFTHLGLAAGPRQALWFSEVVVALEAVLRTPRRGFAAWAGADLHIPVAKSPDSEGPDQAGNLDPQVRLNFVVAGAYSFVDDWDLILRLAVIDRGDKDNPQSTLPILNGGFDQQQITLGVIHNWSFGER